MSHSLTEQEERQRYAEIAADQDLTACEAALALFKQYAKQRPEVVALWSFGLGFALGWKLKIW
ncbi:MAG: hypothetical protein EA424_22270 [Planctomycetaceae bacterium]|nr:MAG: hypothetical protein EA424_22270 [Planctomycetaceae bacterium]